MNLPQLTWVPCESRWPSSSESRTYYEGFAQRPLGIMWSEWHHGVLFLYFCTGLPDFTTHRCDLSNAPYPLVRMAETAAAQPPPAAEPAEGDGWPRMGDTVWFATDGEVWSGTLEKSLMYRTRAAAEAAREAGAGEAT